jgi:rhamnosyltransferase
MNPAQLCGIVVTYHPDQEVAENLRAMVAECGHVLVVDNGSLDSARIAMGAVPGVQVIALGENRGVAAALTIGVRRALGLGNRWVVTFDQDSKPQPGMVAALWASHLRQPRAAIIGPCIVESSAGHSGYRWVRRNPRWGCLFQRVPCAGEDLPEVTMMVTSGSMMELDTWAAVGGFDDGLFIDYVDIDYCLKVVASGRTIAVSAAAKLDHRLGARQSGRLLGRDFRPTHHAAFRHYYMSRNRIRMWWRHGWRAPHWLAFDVSFAAYNLIRVLVWEPGKRQKMGAMIRGTLDGLMGRSGPLPR